MTHRPNYFRLIWGILMVIIYFAMSVMLVFTDLFNQFPPAIRYVFGAIFLIYGVIRAYKIWQSGR